MLRLIGATHSSKYRHCSPGVAKTHFVLGTQRRIWRSSSIIAPKQPLPSVRKFAQCAFAIWRGVITRLSWRRGLTVSWPQAVRRWLAGAGGAGWAAKMGEEVKGRPGGRRGLTVSWPQAVRRWLAEAGRAACGSEETSRRR